MTRFNEDYPMARFEQSLTPERLSCYIKRAHVERSRTMWSLIDGVRRRLHL